jgi:hypothetical protein
MKKSPLRKIIGTLTVKVTPDSLTTIPMEVYECGHYAPPKQDIIGEYYAVRRRCSKCKLNKPAQLNSAELEQVKGGKSIIKIHS